MANGIMNIKPEQMAKQQLAQGQPQPTMNQPGPNVTPNATMATAGVTPIIGGMDAQTKPTTPFSIGADPFERMQDLKDMSDNQIYVGMQQGVITPVEGLITMQTRNEARRRYREQELAKQAGKKSVIEQVTDEFVSGIASNPQMQEEKPVIAKKEGGVIGYYPGGLVETQMELARLKAQLEKTNPGGLFPSLGSQRLRQDNSYIDPLKKRIEELETRIEGFGKMPGMGDSVVAYPKKNFYQPDDNTPFMVRGVEGAEIPETPLMTGEESIGTPENPFGSNQELIDKYTNDARTIFQQKGADDRTTDTMLGILKRESGFNYDVLVGRKAGTSGELGGFQLNPSSFGKGKNPGFGARGDLSAAELSDFGVGANTALDYFTGMKKYFGENYGDLGVDPHEVAIAAYNTGPGNIEKILKNKNNVKALQEGTNFIDLLPESVQGYVKDVLQTETQERLESDVEKMRKERKAVDQGEAGTTFPEARVSTDTTELSGEPSSEMLSQFTGQRPTEENVELEDEQQVVPETTGMDLLSTSKDSFDEKQFRDRFDNALNRGIKKNIPGDAENLVDILNQSVSPDSVKQIVKELYPGNAVKEADKIVNAAIKDVLKTKEDMEQHYKGMRFIKMAQAVMTPGLRLDQALVNMVGVGAAEKEKFIKAQQAYNDKMTKLRSAKAQIMSADEATKGKISGEIYSSYMKANSEAKKAYIDAMAKRAELAEKRIENKIKLVGNKDFMGVMENNFKELEKAIQKKYPSMREDSPEYLTRINTLRNTLLNASTEAFMQGENFDPTPIYMQILGDEQEARRLAVESEKLTAAAREALVAKLPSAKEFADYTSTGLEFLKNFMGPEASQFFEDLKKDLSNFEEFKKKNR